MPFDFPNVLPTEGEAWSTEANTQSSTSPLTMSSQVERLPGEKWKTTLTFNEISAQKGRALAAFLVRLGGRANTFYYGPYMARHPLGSPSGNPTVDGSNQTGSTLQTQSWPANTAVLMAGDYFSVGDELKMVTEDAVTNGAGEVLIHFSPALRRSPGNAEPIEWQSPKCVMRLVNNENGWQESKSRRYSLVLPIEEAI